MTINLNLKSKKVYKEEAGTILLINLEEYYGLTSVKASLMKLGHCSRLAKLLAPYLLYSYANTLDKRKQHCFMLILFAFSRLCLYYFVAC